MFIAESVDEGILIRLQIESALSNRPPAISASRPVARALWHEGVYHFFLRAFVHRIRRIAIRVRRIEDRAAIDLGNPPATIFVPSSPLQPIHSFRLQGLTFAPPGC